MITNDSPISDPRDDLFGVDGFAAAIAKGIVNSDCSSGFAIAITGPWGSGKTTIANLIRCHLQNEPQNLNKLETIDFNPWWYSSEEQLGRAFFRELYSGLGENLNEQSREYILSLAKKFTGAGALVSSAAGMFGVGAVAEKLTEVVGSAISESIKATKPPREEVAYLSEQLRAQDKKFVIFIDDIDRLTSEQALLVFKLIKSVGRLPNVIYVLLFDRLVADRVLKDRYPSDRDFLEKIVQAWVEVPSPEPDTLQYALTQALSKITPNIPSHLGLHLHNCLHDIVLPEVSVPRDLYRLIGQISLSWAAIGNEVNLGDLISLESIKLFKPKLFAAIKANKAMLCGVSERWGSGRDITGLYDLKFLSWCKSDDERESARITLRRLFPRTDAISIPSRSSNL